MPGSKSEYGDVLRELRAAAIDTHESSQAATDTHRERRESSGRLQVPTVVSVEQGLWSSDAQRNIDTRKLQLDGIGMRKVDLCSIGRPHTESTQSPKHPWFLVSSLN